MPQPPTYLFHVLSSQIRQMSKDCQDERMSMLLNNVAIGSLIVMTGFAARQILKDLFEPRNRQRPR